jgi:hypothetical protein
LGEVVQFYAFVGDTLTPFVILTLLVSAVLSKINPIQIELDGPACDLLGIDSLGHRESRDYAYPNLKGSSGCSDSSGHPILSFAGPYRFVGLMTDQ